LGPAGNSKGLFKRVGLRGKKERRLETVRRKEKEGYELSKKIGKGRRKVPEGKNREYKRAAHSTSATKEVGLREEGLSPYVKWMRSQK